MTTTPTKADQAAAERLLKKAVKRAIEDLRPLADPFAERKIERHPVGTTHTLTTWTDYQRDMVHGRVVAMLAAAGTSAALLLGEDAS